MGKNHKKMLYCARMFRNKKRMSMALENKINFAVPLQCQYSAIFDRFYPKMCYTVWGGVIDDEFGKRIGDIGIQKKLPAN